MQMKMQTSLSGPDLSLSPRDIHDFDDDEALRLEAAGFAKPTDQDAFAKLKAATQADKTA